jgi:hypothetical protein
LKEIPLTKGYVAIVDDIDFPVVSQFKWHFRETSKNTGYASRSVYKPKRQAILMHRFILGITDSKLVVDHINGNTLDNRRSNLRVCTIAQNTRNQKVNKKRSDCSSVYKGVYKHKHLDKWQSFIYVGKRLKYLGTFESEIEAARAYNEAASFYFGEFARLNVIDLERGNEK